jgi:4-amino-4-deoxy-L-arabinose transferase-like glycosyltransferase
MKIRPWMIVLWFGFILGLFIAHMLHLAADFPNFSRWMDYSKYTDEGWYGNAAIEHFVRGSWYVPGDFNPAAALPVWPFLEFLVFHFTGVSVVAARALVVAVFGGNLLLVYALVRAAQPDAPTDERRDSQASDQRWVALVAVTLAAASSFVYCFSRLAILEPLLLFFTMSAWLVAHRAAASRHRNLLLALVGLLLCLMILTKTTALFLIPSVAYMLWHPHRSSWPGLRSLLAPRSLRAAAVVAAAAIIPWSAYYFLLVRPRYTADFKYLFAVNVYIRPTTLSGWFAAFWYAFHGIFWIDLTLCVLAAVLLILTAIFARSVWHNPLFIACMLAAGGYIFFIGYQNNMQPRYYTVVAFQLFMAVSLATAALLRRQRVLGTLALAVIAVVAGRNAIESIQFAAHPEYTFVTAARNLTRYIDNHPNGNRLLLSISGNEITLITQLPSICDDFGTLDLPARIHQYQPGWYATWNEMDLGTLEDIHTQDSVEQVARFRALDDSDRNVLILYKLHPLSSLGSSR